MKAKVGICVMLSALLILTVIASAFATDGGSGDGGSSTTSSSGSSARLGGTPKKVCEGTRYSFDNTGVSEYRMKYIEKITGKFLDPRFETVLRAMENVVGYAHNVKWNACLGSVAE